MTHEQQNKTIALLLAIAFNTTVHEDISKAIKKHLADLPPELVAKAASSPFDFSE